MDVCALAEKIMDILAKQSDGRSYKAHKYGIDNAERPSIDYGEDEAVWEKMAETAKPKTYINLLEKSRELLKYDENYLTYFLDGSRRVYKVDDIAFSLSKKRGVIYPVMAGQIGIGCCKRINKKVKPEFFYRSYDIAVPDLADADGRPGFFSALVKKLNECLELKRLNVKFDKVIPYKTANVKNKKYEDKGTACIQDYMIELEKKAVADLVRKDKLDQENFLIKDGSLEYRPSKEERNNPHKALIFIKNYSWVLGVSKNFNPEICVDSNGKSNPEFIAKLPLYSRTPVAQYEFEGMKLAVWYIRLRPREKTRTPFDGIVKVEKMLVSDDEIEYGIDSDLVDSLSANIINERMPTCYGADLRWANHLYPVFLTEIFVKSKYIGTESFLHLF